jgi:hypothetical protein
MAQNCNPSTQDIEPGKFPVGGKPGLHYRPCLKQTKHYHLYRLVLNISCQLYPGSLKFQIHREQ